MVHTMKTLTGVSGRQRRQHERSFKAEMVARCLVPGTSVAAVALAGGVNANLLFKWRRDHLRAMRASGAASSSSSAVLVPVLVAPDVDSGSQLLAPATPATAVPVSRAIRNAGVIELDIGGVQLRLRGPVDEVSLCSLLRALRNRP
jgi:transposase